jgi:hypothetical protein
MAFGGVELYNTNGKLIIEMHTWVWVEVLAFYTFTK